MKLLRFGPPGTEKLGALDEHGTIRDLSEVENQLDGELLTELERLKSLDLSQFPTVAGNVRLGPCVERVGKFICVGLNYADHAKETGAPEPEEPILFFKATSAVCGPNDDLIIPVNATKVDWEVELGVVIGHEARYVPESQSLQYVAGYCIVNDLSERGFQFERGGQWMKGKSCDTFGPIGPWLVSDDEVPDAQNLDLWLEVDGKRYQEGSTRQMIFGVAELVSYVSQFMTLQPGDLISTGTPPGVGMGLKPPVYLRAGQEVTASIQGLGMQRQRTVTDYVSKRSRALSP